MTSVSKSESTASGACTLDDKTATIQYKPATSLPGNNALAHYKQSHGYDQISHALSNIHGLYGWRCNLLDVISVYTLNPGKLPGRFSYKRAGYEAILNPVFALLVLLIPNTTANHAITYVAVPGRNRTLFCCIFQSHYCVRSALA